MAYIYKARRQLKVGNTFYQPGDTVPEANRWRRLRSYVHAGQVVLVQTDTKEWFPPKQRVPLSPAVDDWKKKPRHRFDSQQMVGWGN